MRHAEEDRKQFEQLREKLETRLGSHDHRITNLEAQTAARLGAVEKDVDKLEVITGNHNVSEILDKAAKLAGRGRDNSLRPKPSTFGKLLENELAKRAAFGLLLLLATLGGYILRHVTWNSTPPPAVEHGK